MIGAGEMAEQLRILVVLAEDLGWTSVGINLVATACASISTGISSDFHGHCTHVAHIQTGRQLHTHAHIINMNHNISCQKRVSGLFVSHCIFPLIIFNLIIKNT